MPKSDHANPCIKVCRFDAARICVGCHRTREEVKGWKSLPKEQRAAINRRVLPLMAAGERLSPKRLAKLDRRIVKLTAKLARLRAERDGRQEPPG